MFLEDLRENTFVPSRNQQQHGNSNMALLVAQIRNALHWLMQETLSSQLLALSGDIIASLGQRALLEEVYPWGWYLRTYIPALIHVLSFFSFLLPIPLSISLLPLPIPHPFLSLSSSCCLLLSISLSLSSLFLSFSQSLPPSTPNITHACKKLPICLEMQTMH